MTEGMVVSVQISKGPRMRTLPDIEGDSLTEAASAVTAQGLVPVKSEEERYDDYVPAGQVIDIATMWLGIRSVVWKYCRNYRE